MIEIKKNWIGREYSFWEVEEGLLELGFTRGSMWDVNYASYDYALETSKISDYIYLRVNIDTINGKLEDPFAIVKIRDAWITGAKYHQGLQPAIEIKTRTQEKAEKVIKKLDALFADEDLGEYVGWSIVGVTITNNRRKILIVEKDGELRSIKL